MTIANADTIRPGVTRTHCPYCAFQCGMTITTSDSKSTQAAKLPDHVFEIAPDDFPVNRGQMCIKGHTAGELLTDPGRILSPLCRDEAGQLIPVTWEQAFGLVAKQITELKAKHGPDAIAAFGSGALTNEKAYLLGKFARVALGTSNIDYNGRYCMSSAAAAQNKAFGIDRGLPFPVSDISRCEAVVLWGANCAETFPPIMQWFEEQRANGGKLVVVDPRFSETALSADLHLQLTPGSDLALANGLLHIAIDERLIDLEYIQQRTNGFEAVRRAILGYFPARVERITGVCEADMRAAVRLLARSASSMILSGRGPEQQSKGSDTVLAFTNLMLSLGKVGKPNSGYGCLTGQGNGQGGREHGQKADQLPGYRSIENPEHREEIARIWGVPVDRLPGRGKSAYELCESLGAENGVRALLIFGSNLVVASPNAQRVEENLRQLDLLVVCDSFLNETTKHAHVVLPVTQWAEEEGTTTNLEGRVIHRRPAVAPPVNVKTDIEILCELAKRLGAGQYFPFASSREVFEELRRATAGSRADYSGITYEKIDRQDGVCWPCTSDTDPGLARLFTERFSHPDGRARLHVVEHRPAGEEPDKTYPFYFTTGRYKEHYNSGAQTRRVRKLSDVRPEPLLQMHPRAGERLNLNDGDLALVESRRGNVIFIISLTRDIRPDTVFAPFHWGGQQSANILTNPALDPTSKMPEFKLCAVRIIPMHQKLQSIEHQAVDC